MTRHGYVPLRILACLAVALLVTHCGSDSSSVSSPPHVESMWGSIESDYSGSGPKLVVLGDSITHLSRAELHGVLDPEHRTKIGAVVGEGFGDGPVSAAVGEGKSVMLETATEYARDSPSIVVIALGTNDAWSPTLDVDDAKQAMVDMIEVFADSCVVGVEVNEWSEAENYSRNNARALNAGLRDLVDVIVAAMKPSDVGGDSIHPKPEGRKAFARAVESGARKCGSARAT